MVSGGIPADRASEIQKVAPKSLTKRPNPELILTDFSGRAATDSSCISHFQSTARTVPAGVDQEDSTFVGAVARAHTRLAAHRLDTDCRASGPARISRQSSVVCRYPIKRKSEPDQS